MAVCRCFEWLPGGSRRFHREGWKGFTRRRRESRRRFPGDSAPPLVLPAAAVAAGFANFGFESLKFGIFLGFWIWDFYFCRPGFQRYWP
jgi:hypothetical protein